MCVHSLQEESQEAQKTQCQLRDLHSAVYRLYNSIAGLHRDGLEVSGGEPTWSLVDSSVNSSVSSSSDTAAAADHVGFLAAVEDAVRHLEKLVRDDVHAVRLSLCRA